ncbi:MAG TPA: hypothetical protein VG847_06055 [Chitinophagaceae bacterium]|nr:hypothetical protein [Chitinophagaceae bacterium]
MDLRRCIEIIEGGSWVSLRFITADIKKGVGGKVIELTKARIARKRNEQLAKAENEIEARMNKKNPYHNLNFTRNMELPNKQIRKVHPILITHLNGEQVV